MALIVLFVKLGVLLSICPLQRSFGHFCGVYMAPQRKSHDLNHFCVLAQCWGDHKVFKHLSFFPHNIVLKAGI